MGNTGDSESAESQQRKGIPWTWMGVAATLLYFVGLFWLVKLNDLGGLIEPSLGLALNELGDFLAGAFAPIAFLWLFVAVMVQSQELALQRDELAATRHEYELNREVASAQVEEARNQAAHILAQTKIMQSEWEQRQIDANDALFRELSDRVLAALPDAQGGFSIPMADGEIVTAKPGGTLQGVQALPLALDMFQLLELELLAEEDWKSFRTIEAYPATLRTFMLQMLTLLEPLLEAAKGGSAKSRYDLQRLRLDELHHRMTQLEKALADAPMENGDDLLKTMKRVRDRAQRARETGAK
jgi:hypothetical protein